MKNDETIYGFYAFNSEDFGTYFHKGVVPTLKANKHDTSIAIFGGVR